MIRLVVAIPVCHKDFALVLSNLDRCIELDGKTRHHAVVSYDTVLGDERAQQVIAKASQYFASVVPFRYSGYRGNSEWPCPQNYAWQNTARYFEQRGSTIEEKGWLWWEADALPLKAGWLDSLFDAYRNCRMPFFGHIVEGKGHMNGVAIYPFNISDYVTDAMMVKASPFDMVLSHELRKPGKIARANDFIGHFLKRYGGTAATVIEDKVRERLSPTVVLFHGCTKGIDQIQHTIGAIPKDQPSLLKVLNAWRDAQKKKTYHDLCALTFITPKPTLWHVTERHKVSQLDDERRLIQAEQSWVELYKQSEMRPCHLWRYPRSSTSIGDPRGLPFLKDVLAAGMTNAGEKDIVVLTNDDTILHRETPDAVLRLLANTGACSSFRLNFDRGNMPDLNGPLTQANAGGHIDIGRDLFAFRLNWLKDAWNIIPDFFLGELEWDLILAIIIRKLAGIITTKSNLATVQPYVELERGYVLHELHTRKWTQSEFSTSPSKEWNRRLCLDFYYSNGFHELL